MAQRRCEQGRRRERGSSSPGPRSTHFDGKICPRPEGPGPAGGGAEPGRALREEISFYYGAIVPCRAVPCHAVSRRSRLDTVMESGSATSGSDFHDSPDNPLLSLSPRDYRGREKERIDEDDGCGVRRPCRRPPGVARAADTTPALCCSGCPAGALCLHAGLPTTAHAASSVPFKRRPASMSAWARE